jgi:hypothetical protein
VPVTESWLERMQRRFREAYPLGYEGERMLARLNTESERAMSVPLDAHGRSGIWALNELRVRVRLGLPKLPTP